MRIEPESGVPTEVRPLKHTFMNNILMIIDLPIKARDHVSFLSTPRNCQYKLPKAEIHI